MEKERYDVGCNETASNEIYTEEIVGSVRCVEETGPHPPCTHRHRHRDRDRHTGSQAHRHTAHKHTGTQAHRHTCTDTQTYRQTDLSPIHILEPTRPYYIS